MTQYTVLFESGGVAEWAAPVRKDANRATFTYQTHAAARLTLNDEKKVYLKVLISGMDDITPDGAVPLGFGHCELQDLDGDTMLADIDWYMEGAQDKGRIKFRSGTGKWEGAEGVVTLDLMGIPGDQEAPFPPKGPAKFFGFTEGLGSLSAPNL